MKLEPGDTILTAYAEPASGSGWSNSPVWVIVQGREGKLRQECLQPVDQPEAMRALYAVATAVHFGMLKVANALAKKGKA